MGFGQVLSNPAWTEEFPLGYRCRAKAILIKDSESEEESKEDKYANPPEYFGYFVGRLGYQKAKKKIVALGNQPWICDVSLSFLSKSFRS